MHEPNMQNVSISVGSLWLELDVLSSIHIRTARLALRRQMALLSRWICSSYCYWKLSVMVGIPLSHLWDSILVACDQIIAALDRSLVDHNLVELQLWGSVLRKSSCIHFYGVHLFHIRTHFWFTTRSFEAFILNLTFSWRMKIKSLLQTVFMLELKPPSAI